MPLRVFGHVFLAVARQGEVHQRGGLARCADAVGDLALHGDALEVGRHQLQHEVAVLAAHGHRDQGGGGRVVEEGLARTLAHRRCTSSTCRASSATVKMTTSTVVNGRGKSSAGTA